MTKHSVSDNGDLLKYYAAIPNVVFDIGLNPFELALYAHLKRAAGNGKGAACWKSRATIAKESGMSAGMVTKARQALEKPRQEFGGKPLIVVTEEASKTGGKPTCRVTLTDIWAVNMSKYSTSPHDIATSPDDVAPEAPSPHDRATSHSDRSTSPHAPKEEQEKKNNEEEERISAHALLMKFHHEHLTGPIPDANTQGAALKWLVEHYKPDVLMKCYEHQLTEGWRARVSWLTVKSDIGTWLTRNGNGSYQTNTQQQRTSGSDFRFKPKSRT